MSAFLRLKDTPLKVEDMTASDIWGRQRTRAATKIADSKILPACCEAYLVTAQLAQCSVGQQVHPHLHDSFAAVTHVCILHGYQRAVLAGSSAMKAFSADLVRVPLPIYRDQWNVPRVLLHELAPALGLPSGRK